MTTPVSKPSNLADLNLSDIRHRHTFAAPAWSVLKDAVVECRTEQSWPK